MCKRIIIINGIIIKSLARSEINKVSYMLTTELIIDNSERLIPIVIDSNHPITGQQLLCMTDIV